MKPLLQTAIAALILATTSSVGVAGEGHESGDDSTTTRKDARHGHHDTRGHDNSATGQPGDSRKVNRTIRIAARDIEYDEPEIRVRAGETIKFVVTNTGRLRHEFMIGDAAEQREHAEMMKQMPDMVHEDASTITLDPGETKSLVWQFNGAGALEAACHIPGHYDAGMKIKVVVAR